MYFNGCVSPRIQSCVTAYLKDKPTLAIAFVDMMQTLSDLPENENFDNCLADTLRICNDLAIKNRVEKSSDASACDVYVDPAIKQSCYNEAYPKIAIEKDNPGVCNSLTDPMVAKSCLDSYNSAKSITMRDISWCDRMSVDYMQTNCKNIFYSAVARATKDISFCLKAPTKDVSANCVGEYSRNAGFTQISQCKIIDEYANLFVSPLAKDAVHDQCVEFILNKMIMELPQQDIPFDKITAYKTACTGYTAADRKKICLDLIDIRLKSQTMMAEAAKAAAKAAEPTSAPTPVTGTGASGTPATPNTEATSNK